MAGMWFEYVWDNDFSDGYEYVCSTWLILDDGQDGFVVYNHQMFDADNASGSGTFNQFQLDWDRSAEGEQRARAKYARGATEEGKSEGK